MVRYHGTSTLLSSRKIISNDESLVELICSKASCHHGNEMASEFMNAANAGM